MLRVAQAKHERDQLVVRDKGYAFGLLIRKGEAGGMKFGGIINSPLALDAAHIRWHQDKGPSIASNGLALCSLHHKLFDRGAFSLSDTLTVEVSARVNGTGGLVEYLTRFHRSPITMSNLRSAKPHPRAPSLRKWL